MKDKAYKIPSEEFVENPSYLQNFFLDKEIFDLHISSFAGNKHGKRSKENLELIKIRADRGDTQSILHMAYMYFYGFYGTPVDSTLAFSYFYQAMLKGDSIGEAFVGYMYYQGRGVDKSLAKAFEVFKNGEAKKNYKCMNGLGLMYLRGDYVEKDLARAYKLFKRRVE